MSVASVVRAGTESVSQRTSQTTAATIIVMPMKSSPAMMR